MLRRRQEKIARHKARRAKRRARTAPTGEGLVVNALAQAKQSELKNADDMAALVAEMHAADAQDAAARATARREMTRMPFTRIDGRWHPTRNGHVLRIAAACMLLLACLVMVLLHPAVGAPGAALATTVLWNPTAGSVLALVGMFPVTRYGAKGDGTTNNTTAFSTALARASAAGGGDVLVPKGSGAYMVQTGQLLIPSFVRILGVGRPTIKSIGGANAPIEIFRAILGRVNWSVGGLILDGNQANVTSIAAGGTNNGLITIGANNSNVRIFDNEIGNVAGLGISSGTYAAGNTGITNLWITNNYVHDITGVGTDPTSIPQAQGAVGVFLVSIKKSWVVGNRVDNTGDDGIALISDYVDSNDFCEDCVIAFNSVTTSTMASNIVVDGGGHRVAFNRCWYACAYNNGVEAGCIRIRATSSEVATKHVPYDIVCIGNDIVTPQDTTHGSCGILAECARSQVARNIIRMPLNTTQATVIGIRIYTQPTAQIFPAPLGETVVEDNQINGGINSIWLAPVSVGMTKVRIRRNSCYGAINHSILLAPIDADFLDVSDNLTEGAGGDGIHWTGVWTEGVAVNNTARNCVGYGLNIPSGTQTTTRLRNNTWTNCTAGPFNVAIAVTWDAFGDYGQPGLVAPSSLMAGTSNNTVIANRLYVARLRTGNRPHKMVNLCFDVQTAAGASDPWSAGLYDAAGNRLAFTDSNTPAVNTVGVKAIPLAFTLQPNTTYYLAMVGAVTGTPRLVTTNYGATALAGIFGTTLPNLEAGFADIGAGTTPATLPALTSTNIVPIMVARDT